MGMGSSKILRFVMTAGIVNDQHEGNDPVEGPTRKSGRAVPVAIGRSQFRPIIPRHKRNPGW
jgi:hypothetical protein